MPAFYAYPSSPARIGEAIERGVEKFREAHGADACQTWRETEAPGHFIGTQVTSAIDRSTQVAADITKLNFNVTYEVGYSIGAGKPLLLTRNTSMVGDQAETAELGIFDTIDVRGYESSSELAQVLSEIGGITPLSVTAPLNLKAPVYLLDAKHKTDQVTRIISRVKKAKLSFRSFDPNEQPRLSPYEAISNVAQSLGVLVHLLPSSVQGARIHNLRAAFLAGLADGMGKELLFLQDGDEPVPLDYRDLVRVYRHPEQIDEAIADFAPRVTELLQRDASVQIPQSATFLERTSLGASAAENELRELEHYYLEIDVFQRALRGEVRIVVGRKGSGKTAVFARVRDTLRARRRNVVLDLKPEGYKLLKFKSAVLRLLDAGSFEHTITAFWEYLLLLEICHKILENDRQAHTRDPRLTEPYRRLAAAYDTDEYVAEGDFSERMGKLLARISDDFQAKYGADGKRELTSAEVTELLYLHDVRDLRDQVVEYLKGKEALVLLFDNLDKGWPADGLTPEDLVIIRSLLEASRKVERHIDRAGVPSQALVVLRHDVYSLLIESTPDRGKDARATLDWTDPDLLREVIRRRLIYSGGLPDAPFETLWPQICVSHVAGEESSQYLIDRSLMRPRGLIDLLNHCRGSAVNLRHPRIEASDIAKGVEAYSGDLVLEIGLEIRDVFPEGGDVLYQFIGEPRRLSEERVHELLEATGLDQNQRDRLWDILLWYGVLGISTAPAGDARYIYHANYDLQRLKALARKERDRGGVTFEINPAFASGLGVVE